MGKICIVGASNIKHISLISLYTKYLDEHNIPYDIIYLDRYGVQEQTTAQNQFCFRANMRVGKIKKLLTFWKFRRFAISKLKSENYDLVITWQATTAYLLCGFLKRRYCGKFVMNIRDYIIENNPLVRSLLKRQLKQTAMVTISSEGFLEFLPEADYVRVNSINEELLADVVPVNPEAVEPYKIGFVGNCRFFSESYKLIDALANDPRFELWYCGTNSDVLKAYAQEKNITNVRTIPGFDQKDTLSIMSGFHMVNSAFGNDALDNRTLMPIRLYTALAMHLPMLVNEGTQLAKEVTKGQVGFVIGDYANMKESLYDYLKNLDRKQLAEYCDLYLQHARQENQVFYEKLAQLIGAGK